MDKIEIYDKNTRQIIGPIPKRLFIICVIVMSIITIALIAALFFLPAPNDNDEILFHFVVKTLKI